ncbi:MAG TPA: tryptophan synthase subunit alpha [Steroidobacteraceae bacterium]|nr:tryptophan synthase subunit alpha [Steroidobacteraceae bacterium]
MTPSDKITTAIRAATNEGRPAIVAFLTAGFPQRDAFLETLGRVAAGADVVEIGVPFTDPMADGMTIQRSSRAALEQGVTLRWILESLKDAQRPATPLLLMSYLNPLLAYGIDSLARDALAAGISGFIIPDLPYEESREINATLGDAGLALVQLVTPVTPDQRLEKLCAASRGFVYAVTMTGTTGKSVAVPDEVLDYMDRVRARSHVPVCAGFGIRSSDQVTRMTGHVDGVIVGSALVEVLERGEDPGAFLAGLRPAGS